MADCSILLVHGQRTLHNILLFRDSPFRKLVLHFSISSKTSEKIEEFLTVRYNVRGSSFEYFKQYTFCRKI